MSAEMTTVLTQYLMAAACSVPRFVAVFSMLPLLSRQLVPLPLRGALLLCLALFVVPVMLPHVTESRSAGTIAAILAKEFVVGALLGFVVAIPLWAVETMGDLIDSQRGAAIADTLNPLTGNDASPLAQLFSQAVQTFFLVAGGFPLLLGVVYDSFRIWPVFGWWPDLQAQGPVLLLGWLDTYMRLAVLLAAPVLFAMLLAELGLALLSRYVPQLQVFFLAMPVKSGLAMLMLALYATILFGYLDDLISSQIGGAIEAVSRLLGNGVRHE
ncbi:type III secretion system export apparatus subunit SctT [uncultured Hydrogenophaga sp.]|uniref:type III secretion system export apparatus subunit SctT n=1 Tax=uncultured Hydrogenophaga sp. TaxID=199683 RepID=UPI00265EBF42|nr:type III secretion system export apparatus subunit SctT [uncultured Hydrogenophaga sp.]